jgi:hypothetical protein
MDLYSLHSFLSSTIIYNLMWGDVFPICGDLCGDIWERMKGKEKPCQFIWQG